MQQAVHDLVRRFLADPHAPQARKEALASLKALPDRERVLGDLLDALLRQGDEGARPLGDLITRLGPARP